jgi:hypothetical protein
MDIRNNTAEREAKIKNRELVQRSQSSSRFFVTHPPFFFSIVRYNAGRFHPPCKKKSGFNPRKKKGERHNNKSPRKQTQSSCYIYMVEEESRKNVCWCEHVNDAVPLSLFFFAYLFFCGFDLQTHARTYCAKDPATWNRSLPIVVHLIIQPHTN